MCSKTEDLPRYSSLFLWRSLKHAPGCLAIARCPLANSEENLPLYRTPRKWHFPTAPSSFLSRQRAQYAHVVNASEDRHWRGRIGKPSRRAARRADSWQAAHGDFRLGRGCHARPNQSSGHSSFIRKATFAFSDLPCLCITPAMIGLERTFPTRGGARATPAAGPLIALSQHALSPFWLHRRAVRRREMQEISRQRAKKKSFRRC